LGGEEHVTTLSTTRREREKKRILSIISRRVKGREDELGDASSAQSRKEKPCKQRGLKNQGGWGPPGRRRILCWEIGRGKKDWSATLSVANR